MKKVREHTIQRDGFELRVREQGEGPAVIFAHSLGFDWEMWSFVAPHIFGNVSPESRLWSEDIFGPVLCVTPFDTEADAIALANTSEFGLGAGVWTQNLGCAHRVAAAVRAGNVWVNTYGMLPHTAPFGGVKQSGWGREGGKDVLFEYTQVKNILMELNT
jgi:phenylacetaldehyde dehydrogenase